MDFSRSDKQIRKASNARPTTVTASWGFKDSAAERQGETDATEKEGKARSRVKQRERERERGRQTDRQRERTTERDVVWLELPQRSSGLIDRHDRRP